MSQSLFALILVTTKSPLQVHKNSSQQARFAACRDRGTPALQRPPGSHRSSHLYLPRPSQAARTQHLCRSPLPPRVHAAGSPPRGAATAHGTCPPRPWPPPPGTRQVSKSSGAAAEPVCVPREAGAPTSHGRPRAGQHTFSLRELGAPTPKLPPPPRAGSPGQPACLPACLRRGNPRTRVPEPARPTPALALRTRRGPASARRAPGPPPSPRPTLGGPRRGPAGPQHPAARSHPRPAARSGPAVLDHSYKVTLRGGEAAGGSPQPPKQVSIPAAAPRHARSSRHPPPAATRRGLPVEAAAPPSSAPPPRTSLCNPPPGFSPPHPQAGRPCGCGSRRVRVRARVCARAKAEVAAARRHSLLPGLAVGRDGAAVTLAFAVHACAESSSHCHAPVNPSQPPREQPRPHGDPRSHPHHWPPHARAPPSSPWQRARLTGLPSLRPAGARGGGSALAAVSSLLPSLAGSLPPSFPLRRAPPPSRSPSPLPLRTRALGGN